jgi:hypothetical protein
MCLPIRNYLHSAVALPCRGRRRLAFDRRAVHVEFAMGEVAWSGSISLTNTHTHTHTHTQYYLLLRKLFILSDLARTTHTVCTAISTAERLQERAIPLPYNYITYLFHY